MFTLKSLICWLAAALMVVGRAQAAPWTPERPLYFYRLQSYNMDPIEYSPLDHLVKRSAVKRERILDSLGGDYLIKRSGM